MTDTCLNFIDVTAYLSDDTAPDFEPVSIEELMGHSYIDGDEQATLIRGYLVAARRWVENEIKTALCQRTAILYLDQFPEVIEVRKPPLQSVTSLAYLDSSGASQTLTSTTNYRTTTASRPPRINPAYGTSWPATYPVPNAVTLTMVIGYATALAVPEEAKQAIRLLAGAFFQNREPTDIELNTVRRILDPLRWNGGV